MKKIEEMIRRPEIVVVVSCFTKVDESYTRVILDILMYGPPHLLLQQKYSSSDHHQSRIRASAVRVSAPSIPEQPETLYHRPTEHHFHTIINKFS